MKWEIGASVSVTIPCYRGGHNCKWPACSFDCDGRPGISKSGPILLAYPELEESIMEFNEKLIELLKPLINIADAYYNNQLDDEARRWVYDKSVGFENDTPPENIVLYSGRGGKQLLTLKDCFNARAIILEKGIKN